MKSVMLIVMMTIGAVSLAACNTVQGIGKDVAKGGQAIEKAAR
ncbi:entericidin A/B family lipoprotein [Accumulibacter sp.]|nr:entericidin A/B family lipoprotein [Accumulibacter sp.]MCB1932254.1 entericidin A/B family lipoprotein [Accumulibacter sp.]MCP5227179.1 entericidin A/B family lipoprotein [Accumulibacter sp.]